MTKLFSIKDLESLSGIKAHTIRIWEQRYNFLKPKRTDTNIRYYDSDDLKIVLNTALLNQYGYKISHIDKMSNTEVIDNIRLITNVESQTEKIIHDLINATVAIDLDNLENVLNDYIKKQGLEKTIQNVIFPFLERIGMLWSTSHLSPAQEHFVTNIIRQKIIAGIDNTVAAKNAKTSVLMFLPEGEYHELGLLFTCYLLKQKNIQVYYLGTSVPLQEVTMAAKNKQPNFLHCHLTIASPKFNFEKYIDNLQQQLPNSTILLSGYFIQKIKNTPSPNIKLINSLEGVLSTIIG